MRKWEEKSSSAKTLRKTYSMLPKTASTRTAALGWLVRIAMQKLQYVSGETDAANAETLSLSIR